MEKGSISAEHGVGQHKPEYLHLQKSPQVLEYCKNLKMLFDPKGILNPYKVYPAEMISTL
jgi:D-2-hydroxyglutarate dehydrogenase